MTFREILVVGHLRSLTYRLTGVLSRSSLVISCFSPLTFMLDFSRVTEHGH